MDIDLPLILFLAVALTGIGWLLDWQLNGAKRKRALAGVEAQFAHLDTAQKLLMKGTWPPTRPPKPNRYGLNIPSLFPVLALVFVLRSF